jgi:hypothetical protein
VDIQKAIQAGWSLWPTGSRSPVPDSCAANIDWTPAP